MGILNVDHPDILEFIRAKADKGMLTNFNLSVGVTDAFMEKVDRGEEYPLITPLTGQRNAACVRCDGLATATTK